MPSTESPQPHAGIPLRPRKWTTRVNLVLVLALLVAFVAIAIVLALTRTREEPPGAYEVSFASALTTLGRSSHHSPVAYHFIRGGHASGGHQ